MAEPKTQTGRRIVHLPREGVEALHLQKRRQTKWREQHGEAWPDSKLVFTTADSSPIHSANVSHYVEHECKPLGLMPKKPHQLRHLHASLLLREGLHTRVVSARLGHAHSAITLAVYSHVAKDQNREAASAVGWAMSGL